MVRLAQLPPGSTNLSSAQMMRVEENRFLRCRDSCGSYGGDLPLLRARAEMGAQVAALVWRLRGSRLTLHLPPKSRKDRVKWVRPIAVEIQ